MNNNEITTFLEKVDDLDKRKDCFKLLELFEQWTNKKPKLWRNSIIGFGNYHYKYDSEREETNFSPLKTISQFTLQLASVIIKVLCQS